MRQQLIGVFFCEQIIHKNDFKKHFKATKIAFK